MDWDSSLILFDKLEIVTVPTIWRGEFTESAMKEIAENIDPDKEEGFVVRVTRSFEMDEFQRVVAKWVRKGHVQTNEHWMHGEVKPNGLKEATSDQ